jgi:hypothetical protein
MNNPSIGVLAERLDRLGRENRQWRRVGILAVVVAVTIAAGGARWADGPRRVVAETLVIEGKDGAIRAALGSGPDGGAMLVMYDSKRNARLALGVRQDDVPGFSIKDQDGRLRFGIGFMEDGTSRLEIGGAGGKGSAIVRVEPDGVAHLSVLRGENCAVALGTTPEGTAGLSGYDPDGKHRIALGVQPGGQPVLQLLDETGKVTFAAPQP